MELTITSVPPFDFDLSATIFAGGEPQIRTYEDGKYWQVLHPKAWFPLSEPCIIQVGTTL